MPRTSARRIWHLWRPTVHAELRPCLHIRRRRVAWVIWRSRISSLSRRRSSPRRQDCGRRAPGVRRAQLRPRQPARSAIDYRCRLCSDSDAAFSMSQSLLNTFAHRRFVNGHDARDISRPRGPLDMAPRRRQRRIDVVQPLGPGFADVDRSGSTFFALRPGVRPSHGFGRRRL